jgi:hypothetical protein
MYGMREPAYREQSAVYYGDYGNIEHCIRDLSL